MNTMSKYLAAPALLLVASAAVAQAPEYGAPRYYQEAAAQSRPYQEAAYQPRAAIPQQELDSILAPIALYPDSLLSQLLMAATFPRDVAQAALWSRANPGLNGDEAVRRVENEPWDPAVKSLAAFPEVLAAMGDQPDWTQRLGEAFATNEAAVMQTVQQLRARADKAGNLRSTEQLQVERVANDYVLQPASPEVVYVPYYDSRTVYGDWWWPGYSPVYWGPWAGYTYYSGYGFGWGRPISLYRGFWYGGFNWRGHHVSYSGHRPYYYNRADYSRGWHGRSDGRRDQWRGNDRDGRGNGSWDGRRDGRDGRDGRGDGRGDRRNVQGTPGQQSGYAQRERPQYNDNGRTNRVNPQDGSIRASNASPNQRTVAPRYSADGISTGGSRARPNYTGPAQTTAPQQGFVEGQRVSPVQRTPQQQGERTVRAPRQPVPQQAAVSGGQIQRNGYGVPMRAAPAPQAAPQSAPQSVPQGAPAATRGNHGGGRGEGGGNGGGNRGGGNGRGQER
jgi:Protein of unknown function (DUF3300)